MTRDLFADDTPALEDEVLGAGAVVLRGFATAPQAALKQDVKRVAAVASFRHLITPGGFRMSVAMTNCGELGWVSDRRGYRYDPLDPASGARWPALPSSFLALARDSARSGPERTHRRAGERAGAARSPPLAGARRTWRWRCRRTIMANS